MESVSVSLSIFVATILDQKSKIESISGRFCFLLNLSILSKIMVFMPLSRSLLFSLIELSVSGVIFKFGLSRLRKFLPNENFTQPWSKKIPSFACLVFKTENK